MLNAYANKVLPEHIKAHLNKEEIEVINKIDLKAGYYWLAKLIFALLAAILLVVCVIQDSRLILGIVIALVSAAFFCNWRESKFMEIQFNYLQDLTIVIGMEIKMNADKFSK